MIDENVRNNVSLDWAGRGFSCGLWVDPPGQIWSDFRHDTTELVTVVEGELEMEIEGEKARLGPGDGVYIPARALHTVRNVGGTTTHWLFGYER